MPANGAQQRAQSPACSYPHVIPTAGDKPCTAERHGTRAAYVAGCRCPEARRANSDYAHYRDQRTAQAAFGAAAPFAVPAADTRSVVEQLRGTGWTLRRIEAVTGIGRDHLARIDGRTQRPLRRVRWATHQRLVALLEQEPVVAGGRLIDAYATWQRIHGLIALGYPKAWIARQIGNARALQIGRHLVTARNAEKLQLLADQYGATPGPSDNARAYARRHGWTPDLIWQADDGTQLPENEEEFFHTHQEHAVVDQVAIDRYLKGDHSVTLTRAEKIAALRQLVAKGATPSTAGGRLGINSVHARRYAADADVKVLTRRDDPADHPDDMEATG